MKNGFIIEMPLGAYMENRPGPGVEAGWTQYLDEAFVFGLRGVASTVLMSLPARLGCRLVEVVVERMVKKKISVDP